jgi:5'-3' exonuclease
MSPEEKAIKLFYEFKSYANTFEYCTKGNKHNAKQCALILCNELIANSRDIAMVYDLSFDESENYWTKVKQEIELL